MALGDAAASRVACSVVLGLAVGACLMLCLRTRAHKNVSAALEQRCALPPCNWNRRSLKLPNSLVTCLLSPFLKPPRWIVGREGPAGVVFDERGMVPIACTVSMISGDFTVGGAEWQSG